MPTINELRSERAKVNASVQALAQIEASGTALSAEQVQQFTDLQARFGELTAQMRFITNIPSDEFVALLRQAACVAGNSSAGIKECSYLGTPAVNIGPRQQGRLAADHVTNVDYDCEAIRSAIARQLAHGRYPASTLYYRPDTSDQILNVLANAELYTQKRFYEPVLREA